MTETLVAVSLLLALAWVPIALRFRRGWAYKKNPISLAISAAMALYVYSNTLFAIALLGNTSWRFFITATHLFDAAVVINFYIAFRWADKEFPESRGHYSIPPMNTTNTPR